jgi:polysaccharide deacetylase 2 family uncharacterized protein YibQ
MDSAVMETVLALCRDLGIYFLDSRTTADTTAPAAANLLGVKIEERDVFLDNVQDPAAMVLSVFEGLRKADRQGKAVMIGHAWSGELAPVLRRLYPDLIARGYVLTTVSRLIQGNEKVLNLGNL